MKHKRIKRYLASAAARKREEERSAAEFAAYLQRGAKDGVCFYDSEFGMYNYGDRQGEVVLIGACVPVSEAETEAGTAAEIKAGIKAETAIKSAAGGADTGTGVKTATVFSELIQNTEEAQLAERFLAFTGIKKEAVLKARKFPEVYADFCAFVRKHDIRIIYCLGSNDIERLSHMLELWNMTDAESRAVLSKFCNFQRWLTAYDRRISGFSLESLAALCGVENERAHDALSDAETLCRIWEYLSKNRFSDARIAAEIEAAHQRSRYKKNRRVTFERLEVPETVIGMKNSLLRELRERNREERFISDALLRAICDDLDALLVSEQEEKKNKE